eukprot:gnl/TRDRNA2_/TRDRNA2_153703_c0_seq2.p1 gnl/TRDRNA2_/TRDRNA2_153703_c0~~gnl/TRDRNA2_/TRDRNA2_153703_c0_seq2.p1  ORF type:complete len:197 (-),score=10.32 gnl/TRDRNA2_/TRDRNA2_153703_c0_seq2:75-665(-)
MPAVKECITIHIGQAGCQIGQSLWELFCIEHGIQPDGNNPSDTTHGDATDTYNTFFSETASGKHVPRSVFIDTDPSSKEDILSGKYGKLFHPDSLIGYKQVVAPLPHHHQQHRQQHRNSHPEMVCAATTPPHYLSLPAPPPSCLCSFLLGVCVCVWVCVRVLCLFVPVFAGVCLFVFVWAWGCLCACVSLRRLVCL